MSVCAAEKQQQASSRLVRCHSKPTAATWCLETHVNEQTSKRCIKVRQWGLEQLYNEIPSTRIRIVALRTHHWVRELYHFRELEDIEACGSSERRSQGQTVDLLRVNRHVYIQTARGAELADVLAKIELLRQSSPASHRRVRHRGAGCWLAQIRKGITLGVQVAQRDQAISSDDREFKQTLFAALSEENRMMTMLFGYSPRFPSGRLETE